VQFWCGGEIGRALHKVTTFLTQSICQKSPPIRLIIRLVDRAAQGLFKTPLIAFIDRPGGKISKDVQHGESDLKVDV
jgi:hypothetical protein